MSTIRITKEFRFEGAHALSGYDGKCRHIHGHSYILYVTIIGEPSQEDNSPKNGMLMDFTDLKSIVNKYIIDKYDHSLVMKKGSTLSGDIASAYGNVVIVPFQPTCENLIIHFSELLSGKLNLFSLKLYETSTSYVEWYATDN